MNKKFSIKINNIDIRGIIENPDFDKLMILVHGFTGDLDGPDDIFVKLSNKLQSKGYSVLRFSFSGTLPSGGEFADMTVNSQIDELNEIVNYSKSLGYEDIGILGESMGCTVISGAYDEKLRAVVLWYPVFEFSGSGFDTFLTGKASSELEENGFVLDEGFKVGRKFIEEIPSINFYDKVEEIHYPILFVHGDMDSDVPYKQSEKAFGLANQPKEIRIIEGADHCFRNEQDEVIDLTVDFLGKYFN